MFHVEYYIGTVPIYNSSIKIDDNERGEMISGSFGAWSIM